MGWASRLTQKREAQGGSVSARSARIRPKRDLRLSERLVDLIAPYRDGHPTLKACETLIALAAAAWNLTLLPEQERTRAFREAVADVPARDRDGVADVLAALIQRKEQMFPDDRRVIAHWEVSESENECHVQVASIID
jgi:hypothetical protein